MKPNDDHQASHICLDEVSLIRNNLPVLESISIQLTEQRIGIIGLNGSGKSSFVRLINGLLQPNTGSISVNQKNPSVGPQKMSTEVGFIFQNPDHQIIFPTVEEELSFGLINQGIAKKQALIKARKLLDDHHRLDWAERAIHTLSDGQKQLICILAVVIMQPKVLIFDEPFSALDLVTRYQLMNLIDQLPQQVIMISHELETLMNFDRVIWLAEGKIFRDGPPSELIPAFIEYAKAFRQ